MPLVFWPALSIFIAVLAVCATETKLYVIFVNLGHLSSCCMKSRGTPEAGIGFSKRLRSSQQEFLGDLCVFMNYSIQLHWGIILKC